MSSEPKEVIIIGAGLAGLTCGRAIAKDSSLTMTLLEASSTVGGRVRTDHYEGFALDHGFQVLLTAYPACRQGLDYPSLALRPFLPGARVRFGGRFWGLSDPWRQPSQVFSTAFSPVGTFKDKWLVGRLRSASCRGTLEDLYTRPEEPTLERLRRWGFSEPMIDVFFRRFLGGVFLDSTLSTSSRMLEFVMRMFAKGDIALPAAGMSAIPLQLAAGLPPGALELNRTVAHVEPGRVVLSDGSERRAKHIVMAVESSTAARLLNQPELETSWHGTTTLYFAFRPQPETGSGASREAASGPTRSGAVSGLGPPMLMLGGDEPGPIQSATVLSDVAPEYAPEGQCLISVSVDAAYRDPGDVTRREELESAVRAQLTDWFGAQVETWRHLRTYQIPYGLPKVSLEPVIKPCVTTDAGSIYVCGDFRETASIQGAMSSGERAAQMMLARS